MTPEQEAARLGRLVSAARAVLALQIGLVPGSRRILGASSRLGHDFELSFRAEFSAFGILASQAWSLPASSDRLAWDRDALLERDAVLAQIELANCPAVMADCYRAIPNPAALSR